MIDKNREVIAGDGCRVSDRVGSGSGSHWRFKTRLGKTKIFCSE